MKTIFPQRIKYGSRVAIVAPASSFEADELLVGLDLIKECGLKPVLGPCVKNVKSSFSHAGTVQARAAELNWAFSQPGISAILCVKGGEGSAGLLPHLDYEAIKRSRRPFIGKSDITSLCNGIFFKTGLVTINGMSCSIHTKKGHDRFEKDCESLKYNLQLLMSEENWGTSPLLRNEFIPRTVSPGVAEGIALGGNCDTFTRMLGTEFFPDTQDAILFLEDTHKEAESLARQFLHLQLSGILKKVKGVVLGEFFLEQPEKIKSKKCKLSIDDVILEYFSDGAPCSYGYSFSHGNIINPIPIGARCKLDATTGNVTFDFKMSSSAMGGLYI